MLLFDLRIVNTWRCSTLNVLLKIIEQLTNKDNELLSLFQINGYDIFFIFTKIFLLIFLGLFRHAFAFWCCVNTCALFNIDAMSLSPGSYGNESAMCELSTLIWHKQYSLLDEELLQSHSLHVTVFSSVVNYINTVSWDALVNSEHSLNWLMLCLSAYLV